MVHWRLPSTSDYTPDFLLLAKKLVDKYRSSRDVLRFISEMDLETLKARRRWFTFIATSMLGGAGCIATHTHTHTHTHANMRTLKCQNSRLHPVVVLRPDDGRARAPLDNATADAIVNVLIDSVWERRLIVLVATDDDSFKLTDRWMMADKTPPRVIVLPG